MSASDIYNVILLSCTIELGILAVVGAFVHQIARSRSKRIWQSIERVSHGAEIQTALVDVLTRVLTLVVAKSECHSGLIHRLVTKTGASKDIPRFRDECVDLDRRIQKAIQELMVMHPPGVASRSAARQLSQVFGDHKSLALMKQVGEWGGADRDLVEGIQCLEERLDSEAGRTGPELVERGRGKPRHAS